jgi:site-specific DNA-cytosine methylase
MSSEDITEVVEVELKLNTEGKKRFFGTVNYSKQTADFINSIYKPGEIDLRECFYVLYLNRRNRIIAYYRVSAGGITGTVVDIRLVLAAALKLMATSIIVAHNHPSGGLSPSLADEKITKSLNAACKYHDIKLLDHYIISSEGFFSFADNGLIGLYDSNEIEKVNEHPENDNIKMNNAPPATLPKTISYLDLFSGCGGFAKGLIDAGFSFANHYFSEIDKYAVGNYLHHFKNAVYAGDIQKINLSNIKRPDLITFGSPCQDISLTGKRKGFNGKRSSLFFEAIRLVEALRPTVFIFENVKGIFSSNKGKDFETVLQTIADLGLYECQWQLVNSNWILPQDRERLFFVGILRGKACGKIFPAPPQNKRIYQCITKREESESMPQMNTLTTQSGSMGVTFGAPKIVHLNSSNPDRILRKITPLECERLQGFPDNWTQYGLLNGELKLIADIHRYELTGNAVSVPIVKMIGQRLLGRCQ